MSFIVKSAIIIIGKLKADRGVAMKKLLISGFEPFGDDTINPSWEAVKLLPEEIGQYAITKLCLPVVFGKATEIVLEAAERILPDVIICVGQAGGRAAITPELVAINLRHATIPDNEGNRPIDEPIISDGDTAYFSTLPVRGMAEAVNSSGISAGVSYSAGAYVCNDLIYSILHHSKNTNVRAGFIHVPYCSQQQKEPAMPLSDIVNGLTLAIKAIDM